MNSYATHTKYFATQSLNIFVISILTRNKNDLVDKKMTEKIDLKEIEKKAYTSYHQDGLIDIMVGLFILFAVIYSLAGIFWLAGAMIAVLLPIYIAAKQKFTIPRIGYVKFRGKGRSAVFILTFAMMGFMILGILFMLLITNPSTREGLLNFIENYYNLLIGSMAGGLTLLMAFSTSIKRFYLYAATIFGVFLIGHFITLNLLYSVTIIGLTFLIVGIYIFIQFIHQYPIPTEEN